VKKEARQLAAQWFAEPDSRPEIIELIDKGRLSARARGDIGNLAERTQTRSSRKGSSLVASASKRECADQRRGIAASGADQNSIANMITCFIVG
jgi:hypothetical protein